MKLVELGERCKATVGIAIDLAALRHSREYLCLFWQHTLLQGGDVIQAWFK